MQTKPIILGISGASGSGKSLLAHTLTEEIASNEIIVISEDSYYKDRSHLSLEERAKINYDHPEAFDHHLLYQHLQALTAGEAIQVPVYDFTQHVRSTQTRTIHPGSIIIIEGILVFATEEVRNMMHMRLYMDTPLDICLSRRLRRDVVERERTIDSVIEQYTTTVRPMYKKFIEPTKAFADIIVPKGGANRIAIDTIKTRIQYLLMKLEVPA